MVGWRGRYKSCSNQELLDHVDSFEDVLRVLKCKGYVKRNREAQSEEQFEIWRAALERSRTFRDTYKAHRVKMDDENATEVVRATAEEFYTHFVVNKGDRALQAIEDERHHDKVAGEIQKMRDKTEVAGDQLRVLDLVLDWDQRRKGKEVGNGSCTVPEEGTPRNRCRCLSERRCLRLICFACCCKAVKLENCQTEYFGGEMFPPLTWTSLSADAALIFEADRHETPAYKKSKRKIRGKRYVVTRTGQLRVTSQRRSRN